eukprot:scaffold2949_cov92-Skeletonema_dohrnii-CCMP3373.AAC.8
MKPSSSYLRGHRHEAHHIQTQAPNNICFTRRRGYWHGNTITIVHNASSLHEASSQCCRLSTN